MPFSHGSKAVFKLGTGPSLTDLSPYLTSVDFPATADTVETTTFGKTHKTYIPGLQDHTITIEGIFDPVVDQLLSDALGAELDFEYGPQGSTTGNVKYTGKVICTSYNPTTGVDDAGRFTAEFQLSDAPTRGTY